jgi:hypothetical protein
MLVFEVRDQLRVVVGLFTGLCQHHSGRTAGGQRRVPPSDHPQEGPARVPCAWPQPLRWAQTLDIPRHGGVAPRGALALDGVKALPSLPTPRVPPRAYRRCRRGEKALPRLTPTFALGNSRRLELPPHGHAPNVEGLGDQAGHPSLVVPRPDLCIGSQASRPALRRPCLGLRRWRTRGYWHRRTAIGLGDGGAAPRLAHRLERGPMGTEHLLEGFGKVLQEVKAVGDLRGLRCTRTSAVARRFQTISGDDGDPRMFTSPGGACVRLAVLEQHHRLSLFQVHHDRAVALALPVGPVIDPDGRERRDRGEGQTTHQSP